MQTSERAARSRKIVCKYGRQTIPTDRGVCLASLLKTSKNLSVGLKPPDSKYKQTFVGLLLFLDNQRICRSRNYGGIDIVSVVYDFIPCQHTKHWRG